MLVSEQHTEGQPKVLQSCTSCKSCYKEEFYGPQQRNGEDVLTLPSYRMFSLPPLLSQRNSRRIGVYLMMQQPMAELTGSQTPRGR